MTTPGTVSGTRATDGAHGGAGATRHGVSAEVGAGSCGGGGEAGDEVLFDFVLAMERDRARGGVRRQSEYRALFPGLGPRLRSEYQRFTGVTVSGGDTVTPTRAEARGGAAEGRRGAGARGAPDGGPPPGKGRVIRVLGQGGQGEVVLVWDARRRRHVAVKRLACAEWRRREARARLAREARVLRRLDHPGLCRVLAVDIDGQVPFLVMDAVPGRDLGVVLREARGGSHPRDLPVVPTGGVQRRAVLRFFAQLARALHAAHEAGVVHRDIKPGNIMVTPRGAPVLLDFGMARRTSLDATLITRPGDVLGTRAYMAPEQLEGRAADRRTDVYGLAATLYEAWTLEVWSGEPEGGIPGSASRGRSEGPAAEEHGAVMELLRAALSDDPDQRPATAAAFAAGLEAAARPTPEAQESAAR